MVLSSSVSPVLFFVDAAIGAPFSTDGLSIPSFNLGRNVSLTLSHTWTRTRTGATIPDWAFYARRSENDTDAPVADADVERGAEANGKADATAKGGSEQLDSGTPSAAKVIVTVAQLPVDSNHSSSSGGSVETTEPTKVCFSVF